MGSTIRKPALFLLGICAVAACLDAGARAAEANSAHEQIATYLIDGQKFEIPKSYVEAYTPDHSIIGLEAMLPDLRPADRACGKNGTCDQWMLIVLSTEAVPPVSKQFGGIFVDPTTEKRAGPFGLIEYKNSKWGRGIDIYGKDLKNDNFYWIWCNKNLAPFTSCTYHEQLSRTISLRYRFRRSELKDWEQIHTSVLALISSFQKE